MKFSYRTLFAVVLFLCVGANAFSQRSRTSDKNYVGLLAATMGYGLSYNYQINNPFAVELQYYTASENALENELSTSGLVLKGKYFPFSQNIFFDLGFFLNDWKANIKDRYEKSTTNYELSRKWSSGFGIGTGMDFRGSSKAKFAGTVGLMLVSISAEDFKFENDGGGTQDQKDKAIKKYEDRYSSFDNLIYLYASIGIRF